MHILLGLTVRQLQSHVHNHMHVFFALGYRKAAYSKPGRRRHKRMSELAVPPVGLEPTLGTLLGGRPLPLGYGGAFIIPPAYLTNYKVTKNALPPLPDVSRLTCRA